ncbi:uncharacterized protein [Neodiprion pinetum]|uniref:Uncharacterized protein LOC107226735 isoform X1 n=1 Tax=Neodiprion lecontei TaxID=441921 RepID=A0A6J0CA46_NEOLC|nr:uncharacterized protein LOC107226735 isoform X1 [Neodiprion lecontei]XP_046488651.1 uncharacterized protein LOC124222093 isoform X2 [Neodiprion pinetum]
MMAVTSIVNPSIAENKIDADCLRTGIKLKNVVLRQCTAKIHAECLFEAPEILQNICLFMSADPVTGFGSNWKKFADKLGLTNQQITVIERDYQAKHSSTWWVLLSFAYNANATVEKVLNVLEDMGRLDIIDKISDSMLRFADRVSEQHKSNEAEGSVLRSAAGIEWLPLVLRPLNSRENKLYKIPGITSTLVNDGKFVDSGIIDNTRPNIPLAMRVMLTFASDGAEVAKRITKKFRQHEPRIGVLILKEQQDHVFIKSTEFINDCFEQVDTIIPILTKGYFDAINNPPTANEEESSFALDERYVKYIYQSFTNELVRNDCLGRRVRCIFPEGTKRRDLRVDHLSLRAWYREENIQDFINLLLRRRQNGNN